MQENLKQVKTRLNLCMRAFNCARLKGFAHEAGDRDLPQAERMPE